MNTNLLNHCNRLIEEKGIQVIDLKSIDLTGRLHHISLPVRKGILEKLMSEGVGFDASSYGFSKVENSDMVQIPDLSTAVIDLFRDAPTLSFYSTVHLTDEKRSPFPQDGRYMAKKVEKSLGRSKILQ